MSSWLSRKSRVAKTRLQQWAIRQIPFVMVLVMASLVILFYLWPRILITVGPGESAVLYKRFSDGTVTDYVYPEGFYITLPWNTMYIYNVRMQTHTYTLEALTKSGLPITLDLAVRYQADRRLVGLLHKELGPEYLDKIVVPEVSNTVRAIVGAYEPEEIYSGKGSILQMMVNEAIEKAEQRYVRIDAVLISKISLPAAIREAIERKLAEKQNVEKYAYILQSEEQEAKRKAIEAEGIKNYQKIVDETLTDKILKVKGILATQELAKSPNTKIVVVGTGKDGLPVILGGKE